ncbi:MAG: D-TA family PLP-dependent enzyme [Lachnospiraceae bacterium]|nr:D-TA family PLP-dependent enzyme [Lachnospiraceae bacterium]
MQTYHFKEEASVPSPALIFYKDILEENTRTAIAAAGSSDRLWPHVKSHKSQDFTELQTKMGIKRFKCATIAEAEMAARTPAQQILLAYPLTGPNMERFIRLSLAYPEKTFYCLGDDIQQLTALSQLALSFQTRIPCLVDVNTGMDRTGVSFSSLLSFYKELEQLPGLLPSGLHCYDGNRHEKDYAEREQKVKETIHQVSAVRDELNASGSPCPILIMGGSPTFPCYTQNMDGVYFSPGTVFLYDAGYKEQFPDLPYEPGAAILTRVVSHPAKGYFTLDTGYKAISAEQGIRGIIPELPCAQEAFQSEEHWTFRMKDGFQQECPPIGTILYVIPWHVCPTVALYDKALLISSGSVAGEWPITARSRKLTY